MENKKELKLSDLDQVTGGTSYNGQDLATYIMEVPLPPNRVPEFPVGPAESNIHPTELPPEMELGPRH